MAAWSTGAGPTGAGFGAVPSCAVCAASGLTQMASRSRAGSCAPSYASSCLRMACFWCGWTRCGGGKGGGTHLAWRNNGRGSEQAEDDSCWWCLSSAWSIRCKSSAQGTITMDRGAQHTCPGMLGRLGGQQVWGNSSGCALLLDALPRPSPHPSSPTLQRQLLSRTRPLASNFHLPSGVTRSLRSGAVTVLLLSKRMQQRLCSLMSTL